MRKFCALCGKITEKLLNNLCGECFSKEKEIFKISDINIKICKDCGKIFRRGKWIFYDFDFESAINAALHEELSDKIKFIEPIDTYTFSYTFDSNFIKLILKVYINDIELRYEKDLNLKINITYCPDCIKKRGKYYEAILQIRGAFDRNIVKFIEEKLNEMRIYDGKAFISQIKELKEGIDLYIGSRNAGRKIARMLKKMGAKISESKKLYGRRDGKEIYRYTICIRFVER